ncbi:DUF3365 domain-containing protein [Calothrix sp. UHCC 0171]|uniref:Tll0287-like domain-containing protein n=1 Tax=Calothrix sp. UHCC 0171 TaxID=3110245 RepID=UPI002B216650|nr:DUF3365 domain-containing protein [Calothrix sp. UHCC 0171]MEA5574658.1 DUF3365 domain-containing protein [Calothrix sp. UHCC 0171]
MFKLLSRIILAVLIISVLLISNPSIAKADIEPTQLAKAVQEIEYLDAMRSGLASTLEGQKQEPTIQTFKEVCQPVGMRAKQLSQENGWQVKQIAKKYRNSAHAPDNLHSQIALTKFEQNPELIGFWEQEKLNGKDGIRYYRRINIDASCLACHGAKNSRPQFIKDKYPQDLAFDFHVGDLRGMYAVFIPDGLKEALENSENITNK